MNPLSSCALPLLLFLSAQDQDQGQDKDLGQVSLGATAIATFGLPKGPLHLQRLESSCACQKIELLLPKQAPRLLPHRGKLKIFLLKDHGAQLRIYVPVDQPGKHRESLRLWLSGSQVPLLYHFSFEGVSPFLLSKSSFSFGRVPLGSKPRSQSLQVSRRDGQAFQLLRPQQPPRGFRFKAWAKGAAKGSRPSTTRIGLPSPQVKIQVSFDPKGLPAGPAGGWVTWKSKEGGMFRLRLSAWVVDPVSIKPAGSLVFGLVPKGRERVKRLLLEPSSWLRTVRLKGLKEKGFALKWKTLKKGQVLVELRLLAGHRPGSFHGKLLLEGKGGSRREIPIVGKVLN